MSEKPEILFLAHRIPYPPDKGDKIRSWRLFKHLTGRFKVHLACFVDDECDFTHTEFLEGLAETSAFIPLHPAQARVRSLCGLASGKPLTFGYFRDRRMAGAVAEMRKRPLVAEIAFSSSMAPYIANPSEGRKRIIDFCDADSEKWRQYAQDARGSIRWLYGREGRALAEAETNIANWADASFAITPEEAAIFNGRPALRRKISWWSNGVDGSFFDPQADIEPISHAGDVVFVGAMDYRANVDAVLTFVSKVWPAVRQYAPEAGFTIVGANPVKAVQALHAAAGVTVTGRVADVRPWLQQAKLVVAPIGVARGVQNKVLEALAMSKAVVASPAAMTGIVCADNAVCVAGDPAAMAQAIIRLLNDPERRRMMGETARAGILKAYDWHAQLERFDAALNQLGLYSSASGSGSITR